MQIRIKKLHENAVLPKQALFGDAGCDIVATSKSIKDNIVTYGTGLAFEIPLGYVGLLFPRSSVCKTNLTLCNSVGVLDSGFRGELSFKYRYLDGDKDYSIGDRVGQIIVIPIPQIEYIESDKLSETQRGRGGYGSTGA